MLVPIDLTVANRTFDSSQRMMRMPQMHTCISLALDIPIAVVISCLQLVMPIGHIQQN